MALRVLFVCSRNQWRSPTAERLFSRDPGLETRSAGTARSARQRVTEGALGWADVVVTMEEHHRKRLREEHRHLPPIEVLHIPDEYGLMDPELVELLEASVPAVLAPHRDAAAGPPEEPRP